MSKWSVVKKALTNPATMSKTGVIPAVQSASERCSMIIEDSLYLSDMTVAMDSQQLSDLGITHIVNASNRTCPNAFPDTITYLNIDIDDSSLKSVSIGAYFDTVVNFIAAALHDQEADDGEHRHSDKATTAKGSKTTNRVLVHCVIGKSRSSSLVIAYLMAKEFNGSLRQAYEHTKARRPLIQPNPAFCKDLLEYEERIAENASASASPSSASLPFTNSISMEELFCNFAHHSYFANNPKIIDPKVGLFKIVDDKKSGRNGSVVAAYFWLFLPLLGIYVYNILKKDAFI